jgi:hypothetical protein
MSFPFATSPQFNEHPALGFVGETIASDAERPPTTKVGRLICRSDKKIFEYYDGAQWQALTGSLAGTLPIRVVYSNGVATISIDPASQSAAGSMSSADKKKLDDATSANTASTIVARDVNGDFAAHDITANKVTGLINPVNDTDAVNYGTLKTMMQGFKAKQDSCKAASTANIATLSGAQTIDGVALVAGDRVLVKNQNTQSQNGIYVVASGAWSRSLDADAWDELVSAFVLVDQGTANKDTAWLCTVDKGGTLNTTAITWTYFPGAGAIIAGNGLTRTGNQLDVNVDDSTIEISGNALRVKGGTAGYRMETNASGLATWVKYMYAANIGDGNATSFVLNHGMGTRDVVKRIFRNSAPYDEWITDNEATDANNVTVRFGTAPTLNQFRIVIMR